MVSQQKIPKRGKMYKLTSQKMTTKLTGAGNHWSLISLNINGLNSLIKRHRLTDWIQKQNPFFFYIQETHLNLKGRHRLRVQGWEKKSSNQMDLRNKQM